jgi:anti-sigma regulatory factor (Ser/Thr protein kinase)
MTEVVLGAHPSQVGVARRHVRAVCEGMDPDVLEVAQLLTSELVANAIRHGVGPVRLRITTGKQQLRVAVSDEGARRPAVRTAPDHQTDGRGLMILERLAEDWGVEPAAGGGPGKAVWFTLRSA